MKIIFIGTVDFSRQILLKIMDLNTEIKDRNHAGI
jgi:methionyl-tRNA formyltransferase